MESKCLIVNMTSNSITAKYTDVDSQNIATHIEKQSGNAGEVEFTGMVRSSNHEVACCHDRSNIIIAIYLQKNIIRNIIIYLSMNTCKDY